MNKSDQLHSMPMLLMSRVRPFQMYIVYSSPKDNSPLHCTRVINFLLSIVDITVPEEIIIRILSTAANHYSNYM